MKTMKKLIASVLILCIFLRLPETEAVAAEREDKAITAVLESNDLPIKWNKPDCTGVYTILSACRATKIISTEGVGHHQFGLVESSSIDYPHQFDDDEVLPWNNVSEPPMGGVLIPIIHF